MSIELADFGSFHVGGRRVEVRGRPIEPLYVSSSVPAYPWDPNGDFWVEQAYVQYFIPAKRRCRLPVLLQHGGGLTGSCWETTPDGRPGWLNSFLEAGFATYVIDAVERGRAGFCAVPGEWPGAPASRSLQMAWTMFRFGPRYGEAFPGQRFPVGSIDAFGRAFVPRWAHTVPLQQAALIEAVRKIGPCVLVGHSQGGEMGSAAVTAAPDLVRAAVFIEPSGFPKSFDNARGRSFLYLMGDYLDRDASGLWPELTPKTKATVAALVAAGARADYVDLPERGVTGNSHMLMMDDNSDELAKLVQDWILDAVG